MKEADLLQISKSIYPVVVTRGGDILDNMIVQLSRHFVHSVDPDYPLPKRGGEYPEDPWAVIFFHAAGMILEGKSGRMYFTERSFPKFEGVL